MKSGFFKVKTTFSYDHNVISYEYHDREDSFCFFVSHWGYDSFVHCEISQFVVYFDTIVGLRLCFVASFVSMDTSV